jgi:hypothetical protein
MAGVTGSAGAGVCSAVPTTGATMSAWKAAVTLRPLAGPSPLDGAATPVALTPWAMPGAVVLGAAPPAGAIRLWARALALRSAISWRRFSCASRIEGSRAGGCTAAGMADTWQRGGIAKVGGERGMAHAFAKLRYPGSQCAGEGSAAAKARSAQRHAPCSTHLAVNGGSLHTGGHTA